MILFRKIRHKDSDMRVKTMKVSFLELIVTEVADYYLKLH